MRIGLFTDMYLPSINGISYVLQIMQKELSAKGHEVFIFAPASNLKAHEPDDPSYVYRFPAVEGIFFDEYLTSVFFPPTQYRKIKALNLDLIHFFTPGQIGLMGMYVAIGQDIPLVGQYSTDVYRYVEDYPLVLPGSIALAMTLPVVLKLTPSELAKAMLALRPKRSLTAWHKQLVMRMHQIIHDRCDAVIALSPKMKNQLDSWGCKQETLLLPTGVDAIQPKKADSIARFKKENGLVSSDKILLYAGRLAREKNLELLIDMLPAVVREHPEVKLVLAGGYSDRKAIEEYAHQSSVRDHIRFSGRYTREDVGAIYGAADVFVFPSLTDTQGLVVNEAAAAGLPIVMCDAHVSEIFIANKTGLLAENKPESFARRVSTLLSDEKLRADLGKNAQVRASEYSESGQMDKLEALYQDCIENHA